MQKNENENKIISFLAPAIIDEWMPHFEWVHLEMGQVLHEPGRPLGHMYFPTTAIVSFLRPLTKGNATEVAVTGREGVIGMSPLLGSTQTIHRALVQKAGSFIRIRSNVVIDSFSQVNTVQKLILVYIRTLMTHMSQVSVCHKHHTLEQQLSRLLMLTLDRQNDNNIELTHEFLAILLGVRREGVTQAAHRLMTKNILTYNRGHITVLDPKALATQACECHSVIRQSYQQFFSQYE